jgi:hypothetical protein
LSLFPKPLSDVVQNVPSSMTLMPEKPCTGWPSNGIDRPVARTPSLPGTVPRASTRRRSGEVYFADTLSESGASAGGATKVAAGRMAWPTRVASYSVSARAGREVRATMAVAASRLARMGSLPFRSSPGRGGGE